MDVATMMGDALSTSAYPFSRRARTRALRLIGETCAGLELTELAVDAWTVLAQASSAPRERYAAACWLMTLAVRRGDRDEFTRWRNVVALECVPSERRLASVRSATPVRQIA
jgi:hypothetical protein